MAKKSEFVWAVSSLLFLSACYASHEAPQEATDAGASDISADSNASDVSADECVPPDRCGVRVEVSWRADLPAGAIDRVIFITDMNCYVGFLGESTSMIGSSVSPVEPRRFSQHNVCSGCFFVSARALDADGRELARGREDFCSDATRDVLVTLR